jgi:lysophospholipase L1-like esterase
MFSKALRSFTALLLIITGCKARQVWHTEEEYYRLPRWDEYVARFEKMNYAPHTTTLFLGDSMTEGFNLNRHFKQDSLVNMGIGGDFTSGVLRRLYQVEQLQPKKIFVMIGINDIGHDVEQPRIESQYAQIIQQLKTLCPVSEIYIQSCLPTNLRSSDAAADAAHQARIVQLNTFIEGQCALHQVQYIHLYPLFQASDGYLHPDLTYDGLHLNEAGYRIWADAIRDWVLGVGH